MELAFEVVGRGQDDELNKIGLKGIEYSKQNILKIYLATQSARMAYVPKPCFYFKAKTKCAIALTFQGEKGMM